jgi:hypothetical protein
MTTIPRTAAAILTIGLLLDAGAAAAQQTQQQRERMRQHQVEPGMRSPEGRMQDPGMMGRGMMGQGMMGQHPMAGREEMMEQMHEMMERMHEDMPMPPGMRGYGRGQIVPDFGMRVTPMMHLSADDVRRYLTRRLEAQGFERLQVGSVEEVDDETISAEIVTVDDSLVTRLEVDRYTGLISRAG